ncbi:MAG: nucleotide exchange factor GrpE [Erysipelotrichaceae bacterium]
MEDVKQEETVVENKEIVEEEKEQDVKPKGFKEKKLSKEIEKLKEENEKLNLLLTEAKNNYFKAYADADNLKKRLQLEADNTRKYRIQSFALEVLPVIDNFERALEKADKEDAFVKGVDMVYQQLVSALKNEGVSEIEALNKSFDPNLHQALMTEQVEGVDSNIIIEVLQKGYMLKDRILRASLVKVSE